MSGPLRSKQGCWTCRLRKKKCDERPDHCSTCEELSITCYGFGPKPDWMDNGEREKAVANSLKQTVKYTSRRKPLIQPSKQPERVVTIAPKPSTIATGSLSSETGSSSQHGISPPLNEGASQEDVSDLVNARSSVSKLKPLSDPEILIITRYPD